MKKLIFCAIATLLSVVISPLQSAASLHGDSSILVSANKENTVADKNPAGKKEAQALLVRLYEINGMDKTNMVAAEKKGLRKEVRSINRQLKDNHNGIYLSVGAAIIIVLLLILLL